MTLDGIVFWFGAILVTLLILGVLVLVHEFGHFATARLLKIRVLEFGIGFPPRAKVLGRDHETEYTLNWLPIGGFCKLEGEDADSDDPRAFGNASLLKQLVVLVAGVTMNVLTAVALFFLLAWLFNPMSRPTIDSVLADSPAAAIGLQPGDSVVSIDGRTYSVSLLDLGADPLADFRSDLAAHAGKPITLGIADASGHERTVTVTLRVPDAEHSGALGVGLRVSVVYPGGNPVNAAGTSISATGQALSLVFMGLGDLASQFVNNPTQAPSGIQGPVGITDTVGVVLTDYGPVLLVLLAAILSANLALVNILPFPPLDGGRIAILVAKRIAGKRGVSAVEATSYLVGFALLIGFVLWISFFDLVRLGSGGR